MFVDNDFPKLLGAELYRPHPAYVVEMAAEPVVVHDFLTYKGLGTSKCKLGRTTP
ncbi:MAG: hypothetical protein ACYSYL_01870 [Planctomycetota bacterium]